MFNRENDLSVGCVISYDSGHPGSHQPTLGLVVDPVVGKSWADNDSHSRFIPPPENVDDFLLVRVLGTKLLEHPCPRRFPLFHSEPNVTEVVRWEYALKDRAISVAGPSHDSLAEFVSACQFLQVHGMNGATFLYDLKLLQEYLSPTPPKRDPGPEWEKYPVMYLAMLAEVLPKR